ARNPGDPNAPQTDRVGWNFWTSNISQCVFDLTCVHGQRINTGLGFMYSTDFIQRVSPVDPVMAHPPGSPGFDSSTYNPRFVYWCYRTYLQKEPDAEGWDFWTRTLNSDGNYGHIIDSFQVCDVYRGRQFQ